MDVFPLLVCEGPFKDVTVSDGRDFSISIFGIESLPSVYGIFFELFCVLCYLIYFVTALGFNFFLLSVSVYGNNCAG